MPFKTHTQPALTPDRVVFGIASAIVTGDRESFVDAFDNLHALYLESYQGGPDFADGLLDDLETAWLDRDDTLIQARRGDAYRSREITFVDLDYDTAFVIEYRSEDGYFAASTVIDRKTEYVRDTYLPPVEV